MKINDPIKQQEIEKLKSLLNIKQLSDIKSLDVVDEWEDDHEMCYAVEINGVVVEFLWMTSIIGALTYYNDSPRAFNDLIEAIKYAVETELEEMSEED